MKMLSMSVKLLRFCKQMLSMSVKCCRVLVDAVDEVR